ncbi:MAG TPA: hypothetical protein VM492_16765 [Sumerlaeia bacterium]|nr:hypothetical protein [Sumerlaeia bacterium]
MTHLVVFSVDGSTGKAMMRFPNFGLGWFSSCVIMLYLFVMWIKYERYLHLFGGLENLNFFASSANCLAALSFAFAALWSLDYRCGEKGMPDWSIYCLALGLFVSTVADCYIVWRGGDRYRRLLEGLLQNVAAGTALVTLRLTVVLFLVLFSLDRGGVFKSTTYSFSNYSQNGILAIQTVCVCVTLFVAIIVVQTFWPTLESQVASADRDSPPSSV